MLDREFQWLDDTQFSTPIFSGHMLPCLLMEMTRVGDTQHHIQSTSEPTMQTICDQAARRRVTRDELNTVERRTTQSCLRTRMAERQERTHVNVAMC
jgi:hypothetical protein